MEDRSFSDMACQQKRRLRAYRALLDRETATELTGSSGQSFAKREKSDGHGRFERASRKSSWAKETVKLYSGPCCSVPKLPCLVCVAERRYFPSRRERAFDDGGRGRLVYLFILTGPRADERFVPPRLPSFCFQTRTSGTNTSKVTQPRTYAFLLCPLLHISFYTSHPIRLSLPILCALFPLGLLVSTLN